MTLKNCPYCGTPLQETTFNRLWCPNHGIIEDNPKSEESEENKKRSYLG
jgi:uncharacterized Zn finger protein (UPF0148 family)